MTITRTSGAGASSIASGNAVFAKPTVSVGDLLVVVLAGNSAGTFAPPALWTTQEERGGSGGTSHVAIYTHVVTGSEGSSFTFTYGSTGFMMGYIMSFTGVDAQFPVDVHGNSLAFNTANVNMGTLTTRLNNEYLIAADIHFLFGSNGPTVVSAIGSSVLDTHNSDYGFSIRESTLVTAGATPSIAWNWSAAGAHSAMAAIALRPAGQNISPSVDAGIDATLIYGDTFTRTAIGADPEGPVTYAWSIVSAPGGSTATISGAATATAVIKPDKVGSYTLRCTVTDNSAVSVSDDMVLTVRAEMWTRVSGVAKPGQRRIRKAGGVA